MFLTVLNGMNLKKREKKNQLHACVSGCITDKSEASVSLGCDLLGYTTKGCHRCYNDCSVQAVCGSGGLLVAERRRRKMEELFANASLCDCYSANIRVGGSEREPAPRRAKTHGLSARHGGVCSTHTDGASSVNCGGCQA